MENFTPLSAATGGVLIGLSAALLWVAMGRIAGISGILGGLIGGMGTTRTREIVWRLAFLAGLVAAPLLYRLGGGELPEPSVATAPGLLIAAGLLVGFARAWEAAAPADTASAVWPGSPAARWPPRRCSWEAPP